MSALDALRDAVPEPARDTKLNLQAVLGPGALGAPGNLTAAQRWGVAVATAAASRNAALLEAVLRDAAAEVEPAVVEDALAAASLMAMNNVYYRFRHMVGKDSYGDLPARLRMNRLARPAGSKVDFELFALAVSAINGCESCVQAHEKTVLEGGLTEAHVNDAIRIAATIHGVAIALNSGRN
jgi:alkyl hydroperoxide reductase subunit D